ncbi:MAG: phosphotransferase [Porticoccaceae bacterium]|nr:phosphotransferase [Porticoccaceae bacterium]
MPDAHQIKRPIELQPLAGDAGFRRYFRILGQPSIIAVDSPPDKEKNQAYISVALAFQRHGIRTPKIFAVDFANGFFLLEDFGLRLLQPELSGENPPAEVAARYSQAEQTLMDIQRVDPQPDVFPAYDRRDLQTEMDLFGEWFVGQLLGISLDAAEQQMLQQLYQDLLGSAADQPQVVVHKDFHSRNLMLLEDSSLGVIDFQDAVVGPVTYDLVSLLKDCYLHLPDDQVVQRALAYKQYLEASNLLSNATDQEFLCSFDKMGLQRHIKVLGIFARLYLRDGKAGYLNDLPLVIRYTLEAAQRYSQTQAFYHWFIERIEPLLSDHPWYREWRTATEAGRDPNADGAESL